MSIINPLVEASRMYRFEASHRPGPWPDVLGLKESRHHGHNFLVFVNTKAKTNTKTGLSVNLNDLDVIVDNIINQLDHKHLNQEYFNSRYPTTHEFILSHIAEYLFNRVEDIELVGLRTGVSHSFKSEPGWKPHIVYSEGGNFMKHKMFSERSYQFTALHRLISDNLTEKENDKLYGKCVNLHGHDYILDVTVVGIPNDKTGVIVPYNKMDRVIEEILEDIDGTILNSNELLGGKIASSENILIELWKIIEPKMQDNVFEHFAAGEELQLYEISLQETDRNTFVYRG